MRRAQVLWLAALLSAPASAAIQVSPIRIELTRAAPNTLVALSNSGGTDDARFELQVVSWNQDDDGKLQLENTKDVFLYPPLLTLKPGERRNVRVAVEPAIFGPVEKTYRLIAQELPRAPKPGARQVQVLTRLSIPIFVAPEKPVEELRVDALAIAGGRASFQLVNAGNVAQRPVEVTIDALDASGASVGHDRWDGWYVLAGGRRAYAWPIPAAACKAVASLSVKVKLEKREVAASAPTPRGACGS